MKLGIGYELMYDFPQPMPAILVVNVHDSRAADLFARDDLVAEPHAPSSRCHDSFGNLCHRILAPAGRLRQTTNAVISDSGRPDEVFRAAGQDTVQDPPQDKLQFLLGSRYCETDLLSGIATTFGPNTLQSRRVWTDEIAEAPDRCPC